MMRVICLLAMSAILATVPIPTTTYAAETDWRYVAFSYIARFTGPDTIDGTFSASGAIEDSGTCQATFSIEGGIGRATKTLVGRRGTLTVCSEGAVSLATSSEGTPTGTLVGRWEVLSGTGAYARLSGLGVATVWGDFFTGELRSSNAGQATRHGRDD